MQLSDTIVSDGNSSTTYRWAVALHTIEVEVSLPILDEKQVIDCLHEESLYLLAYSINHANLSGRAWVHNDEIAVLHEWLLQ